MLSINAIGKTTITWQARTENTDGSSLTDLAGFRLYYGQISGTYTDVVQATNPTATSYALALPNGKYFVAMTAINREGNESAYSNEIMRTLP